MKRWLMVLCLVLTRCHPVHADPPIAVQHAEYKTWFDQSRHVPLYVRWVLTPSMLPKFHFPRTDKFTADPKIPGTNLARNYSGSGFDQGHQMPAEDAASSRRSEMECFYFSNMEPQRAGLNRIVWKNLEAWCREEVVTKGVTLIIVCGGYKFDSTIGPDRVAVPSYCWKAIYEGNKWFAYMIPNTESSKLKPFSSYSISMKDLDAKVGVKVENLK